MQEHLFTFTDITRLLQQWRRKEVVKLRSRSRLGKGQVKVRCRSGEGQEGQSQVGVMSESGLSHENLKT